MKKIASVCVILMIFMSLCGCAKCIRTDTKTVEVKIVDKYHHGTYITPMIAGKINIMVTHPAVYEITVEYNGVEYTISGSDTYSKYKDKIGQTTNAELQIEYYDDESIIYDIISLE